MDSEVLKFIKKEVTLTNLSNHKKCTYLTFEDFMLLVNFEKHIPHLTYDFMTFISAG
jgi:hypothetical protein